VIRRLRHRVLFKVGPFVEGEESSMRKRSYGDEAEACRRQAEEFTGRPEAQFLLRAARSFEELDRDRRQARQAAR
jgi:hypothetical protein